jgi:PEP-CTERM motif
MQLKLPLVAVFGMTMVGFAPVVGAEPITLNYQVSVGFRHDFTLPPTQWHSEPISPVTFPLSMTFEPAVTRTLVGEGFSMAFFGFPQYSPVPLSGAGLPAHRPNGGSFIVNFGSEQAAYADGFLADSTDDTVSLRGPRLFADLHSALPPGSSGDPATFIAAMQSPGLQFFFFDYAFDWRDSSGNRRDQPIYAPNSAGFSGTATFLNAATVPEPATVVLVGAALAAVAARARRERRIGSPGSKHWSRHAPGA